MLPYEVRTEKGIESCLTVEQERIIWYHSKHAQLLFDAQLFIDEIDPFTFITVRRDRES